MFDNHILETYPVTIILRLQDKDKSEEPTEYRLDIDIFGATSISEHVYYILEDIDQKIVIPNPFDPVTITSASHSF